MIADIWTAIGESISGFTTNLSSAFTGITGMFYGGTPAALTPLGLVTLITAGVAIVVFAFTFIYKLIRKA